MFWKIIVFLHCSRAARLHPHSKRRRIAYREMCAAHCYETRSDYRRWSGICRCYVASEMLNTFFSFYFNRRFLRTSELPSGKTHSRKKEKKILVILSESYEMKKRRNKLIHIKQGCTNKQRIMETSQSRQSMWGFFTVIYCIRNKPDFRIRTPYREGKKPCNALTKERICNPYREVTKTTRIFGQKHHARHPDISIKVARHVMRACGTCWFRSHLTEMVFLKQGTMGPQSIISELASATTEMTQHGVTTYDYTCELNLCTITHNRVL